jgi:hypothetical protein
MRQTGILKRLFHITWPPNLYEIAENPPIFVSVNMVINLLLLLASGMTAAIVCLILELVAGKLRQLYPSNYLT